MLSVSSGGLGGGVTHGENHAGDHQNKRGNLRQLKRLSEHNGRSHDANNWRQ
jgi:hypothetical protein